MGTARTGLVDAWSRRMHPAFSVIFFTTAVGAGYGLLLWTAVCGRSTLRARPLLRCSLGLLLVTVGLLSSTCPSRPAGTRVARAVAMAVVLAVA